MNPYFVPVAVAIALLSNTGNTVLAQQSPLLDRSKMTTGTDFLMGSPSEREVFIKEQVTSFYGNMENDKAVRDRFSWFPQCTGRWDYSQFSDVLLGYVESHPQHRHLWTFVLFITATAQVCPFAPPLDKEWADLQMIGQNSR